MAKKVRKVFQLDPKQAEKIRKEAFKKRTSESEVVRRAVATYFDQSTGLAECPHCGKAIMWNTQSSYLPSGERRQRWQNTVKCPECGEKYKLEK